MIRQMDKDGDESISRTEYLDSMSALADCLGDEEFERGVLETLATKPLISDLTDRESKMTALFRHLDADASGDLEVDELLAVFVDDAEVDPIEARRKAKAQLAYLDEDGDGTVDHVVGLSSHETHALIGEGHPHHHLHTTAAGGGGDAPSPPRAR